MSWADSCDLEYALAEFKAESERLQAENDSLRKELAADEPLFETLNAANDGLISENEKLRELARDYDKVLDAAVDVWGTVADFLGYGRKYDALHARMRELGVEV